MLHSMLTAVVSCCIVVTIPVNRSLSGAHVTRRWQQCWGTGCRDS